MMVVDVNLEGLSLTTARPLLCLLLPPRDLLSDAIRLVTVAQPLITASYLSFHNFTSNTWYSRIHIRRSSPRACQVVGLVGFLKQVVKSTTYV